MWDGGKKFSRLSLPSWTPKALILGECLLLFLGLYMSTNYLNSVRSFHFQAYFDWELQIPLIPEMMFFYSLLYVVPFALPQLLRQGELVPCAQAVKNSLYVCSPIFLLFPTELGFSRVIPDASFWAPAFAWVQTMDHPHNLVPSFHVVLSTLVFMPLFRNSYQSNRRKAYLYLAIMFLVDVSIIFVHQHHLLDLFVGLGIGLYFYNKTYLKAVLELERVGELLPLSEEAPVKKDFRRAS